MTAIMISGLCGQWIGIVCIITGLVYEVKHKAHWGFIFITAGSLVYAIGTKVLGF